MKINSLKIKNFRCFKDDDIVFSSPDGVHKGSGLNIFIGENGTGKTTVLESISFLTQSRLKTKNNLGINDFSDINSEIIVEAETDTFQVDHVYGRRKFNCHGLTFKAKTRDRSVSSLSNQVVFDNYVLPSTGETPKDYELRTDVTMPWGNSRLPNIEVVFFDKNRTRHITKGMFNTKFDSVIEDLNYKVLSKIQSLDDENEAELEMKQKLLGVNNEIMSNYYNDLDNDLLVKINKDCKTFFDNNIQLDIFNNLEPYINSFFSAPIDGSVQQIPVSKLGSGFETIISIIFLYHYFCIEGTNLIILIDEPELHLHPSWQKKLIDYLVDISKNTQVFVSTHSPYIYKNCLTTNAALHVFSKDNQSGEISIDNAADTNISHFPWSPSWGEINYYAFNLPTIEFHNELYGYLQFKNSANSESQMETLLTSKGIVADIDYIKVNQDGSTTGPYKVTLCTYIRNLIHHPENTNNNSFTDAMLKTSVETLLSCL